MITNRIYKLLLISVLVFGASCSTQKDGFSYRAYHNVTAHFNGHFNAEESIKKGLVKIETAYKPDYDSILPVFVIGTEETAPDAFPEMERAIEKSEKVISRHTLKKENKDSKKHPVFNKWIDENYMVIGKSNFYKRNYLKAEQAFKYVNGKYKDPNTQLTSATWLARTYTEKGEYSKATLALSRFEPKEENKPELKADYHKAMADLLMHQGDMNEAVKQMEKAISYIKKKKDRARPYFILAQMYQRMNRSAEAITNYEMVLKSRPPYELAFYAKINKALSFSRRGGSSEGIKKELMKMLKDEKNEQYRDQIYFALGDLALEEQDRPLAIYYFEEALRVNDENKKQRAKIFLKLADLYFNERQYANAQSNYDSTLTNITTEHPRFREVKARAESLTELIGYLNTIELNDSINVLCSLSEEELEKALNKAVKDAEKAADAARRRDEELAAKAAADAANAITGNFWAYNQNLREKGKENFLDYWGDRPLKDNWRLQSKLNSNFSDPDESIVTIAETTNPDEIPDKYKVPTMEELRASLPCGNDKQMKDAQLELAEAYYRAGVVYKENLEDFDNATDIWEQQILNIEESDFHPMTLYQLYRTWLYKEQLSGYKANPFCETCSSVYWASQVKERYPSSEWARLIDNPEYLDEQEVKRTAEKEAYEETYKLYARRNYYDALTECNRVITEEPNNHLMCKYRFLKAVCIGYTDGAYGIRENFIQELNTVKADCPETEEAAKATEILNTLNKEATLPSDPNNENAPKDPEEVPKTNVFKLDLTGEHYFAIVMPVQGTNISNTKATISDYNATNFASNGYKVTNNLLNKDNHIILVKPFPGAEEGKTYMGIFTKDQNTLKDINEAGYTYFLISKTNYIALFKNKNLEEYLQFFADYY